MPEAGAAAGLNPPVISAPCGFRETQPASGWCARGCLVLLKDRSAIVTGAGNKDGIGFAVARTFVEHGRV